MIRPDMAQLDAELEAPPQRPAPRWIGAVLREALARLRGRPQIPAFATRRQPPRLRAQVLFRNLRGDMILREVEMPVGPGAGEICARIRLALLRDHAIRPAAILGVSLTFPDPARAAFDASANDDP